MFGCLLAYIISVLSRLAQAQIFFSLCCAYMTKSSEEANHKFCLNEDIGGNSRSERVNINTVWTVFQKVWCKTYHHLVPDLIITYLYSGFQGVILHFNDGIGF